AVRIRLEISNESVCYPVRRAIYAGAWVTRCSTASPTKMRTGSIPEETSVASRSATEANPKPWRANDNSVANQAQIAQRCKGIPIPC
ncbi:hypothetical protein, partial [Burkholderia sp. AU45388]|uniref:hypothetical protein n=1 Tax=Burkholderia sp. AU45388 TaxID=3059206 RepID=UPI00264EF900